MTVDYVLKRSEEGAVYLVGNREPLADFAGCAGVSVRLIIYDSHITDKNAHGLC